MRKKHYECTCCGEYITDATYYDTIKETFHTLCRFDWLSKREIDKKTGCTGCYNDATHIIDGLALCASCAMDYLNEYKVTVSDPNPVYDYAERAGW